MEVLSSERLFISVCKSQYVSSKLGPCVDLSSTSFIERFFDLIFTEFHNTPPACVCIQMCPKQPTYCYPNGCLKRPERKGDESNFVIDSIPKFHVEVSTKSAIFGVDQKDVEGDLLEESALFTSYGGMTERSKITNLIHRLIPFKDLVFKYNKIPKLEMKYNLREQVKNTKSERLNKEKNMDISKTRWPSNKHLLHGQSSLKRMHHYKKNDGARQTKFFVSLSPENEPSIYSPVFYKKYLTKRDSNGRAENAVNVEALYLYRTDATNFTLENYIENFIEGSLNKTKKDTMSSSNTVVNNTVNQENSTETNINLTDINFLLDDDKNANSILNNAVVNIISMDSTKEDIDVNKYSHDTNMTNHNIFLELIANMSKKIELQNQASLEFIGRVMGTKQMMLNEFDTSHKRVRNNITTSNITVTESIIELENFTNIILFTIEPKTGKNNSNLQFSTTEKPVVPVTRTSIYRKSKKRVIRKLKPRKIN
ncbi:uncharacterized protein LOC120637562 [Pararge aegeria]|uniref:uncharacterized protein LOC120637562 n=1 Tax=Pararge aegeria TaxID=116150 RepID=UPI0019CF8BF9|nr:uncharacterized protein LOC120637562 [Pararge aegeria]